jgi:hypothetical protein
MKSREQQTGHFAIRQALLIILLLFVCKNCLSQDVLFIRGSDSIAANIDIKSKSVEKFRWLLGYVDYSTVDNDLAKIIYSYKAGPRQIIETFYIKDSLIVCATKQAESYYLYGDSTFLLGKYYFEKGNLKYCGIYRDVEEREFDQIQQAVMKEYNKTLSIISWHQKKKNALTDL